MSSRLRFLVLATMIAMLCFASTSAALEKTVARYTDNERDVWNRASTSCQVVYYNICQGWIWIWSGWSPGDQMGTWFQSCCPGGFDTHQLLDTFINIWTPSPSGYGFTGTIDVWAADVNGCPTGASLRATPFLPGVSGWAQVDWSANPVDVSGGDFVVTYTLSNTTLADPLALVTDHPAAGPTGPAACGTCFPTSRAAHSNYYASAVQVYCPGQPLFDGVCDAEWLWDVSLSCATSVDDMSWTQIKGLYR